MSTAAAAASISAAGAETAGPIRNETSRGHGAKRIGLDIGAARWADQEASRRESRQGYSPPELRRIDQTYHHYCFAASSGRMNNSKTRTPPRNTGRSAPPTTLRRPLPP